MLPFVRVVGEGAPSHVLEVANNLGRKYAGSLDVGVTRPGDQKYIPATEETRGYGFIVRPFENRVDVILLPPSEPVEVIDNKRSKLLTLVHGPVGNLFIGDKKPVSVYSALEEYALKESPQITHPASAEVGKPASFKMPIDASKFAHKWSHLVRVKPSMYSGHLREVVQIGLGIGFGDDQEEYQHDFKSLTYRVDSLVTDGIIFAENKDNAEQPKSAFERMRPVVVQVRPTECLFAPLVYWDEAYYHDDEIRLKKVSEHEKWREYVARVEKQYGDTLVSRIVDVYGGVPTPESPFEVDTTLLKKGPNGDKVQDKAKAREQRVKAGVYVSFNLGAKMAGWSAIHPSRGWAFSYDSPMAVQVQSKPYGDFPKHRVVTLTFKVEFRDQRVNTNVPSGLVDKILENISSGKLDSLAAMNKLKLADESSLLSLSENFSVAAFDAIEVDPSRTLYKVHVGVSLSKEMTLFNPVVFTPHGTDPAVHFKFPGYWDEPYGCNTWLPVPTIEKASNKFPKEFGQAPVDAFFTKEGELIVVENNASTGDGEDYIQRSATPPDCYMVPFSMTEELIIRSGAQVAGLNVYSHYTNLRTDSGTDTKREMTYLGGWAVKVGYRLDRPDLGYCWKTKYAIAKTTVKTWHGLDYTAAHCAPFNEREILYLAEPRSGKVGVQLTVNHAVVSIDHPVTYGVGHCFPGWWFVNPTYFQCGGADPEGVCPSYPGQHSWWYSHKYPTLITDGPYSSHPSPCDAFTGTESWMTTCQNAEEVAAANPVPSIPPLPEDIDVVPPNEFDVKIMAAGTGLGRGALTLYSDHSASADISEFWDSISPDSETGLTAIAYASNNCSGRAATTIDISLNNRKGIKRLGAATEAPMKDLKHPIYVGVAIKGKDNA